MPNGFLVLLAASFGPAAGASNANLISDPGFESDGQGWQKVNNGGRSIVTDTVHSGAKAQQMIVHNQWPREVYQDVPILSAAAYDVAGWVKTSGVGGAGSRISLLWLDATGVSDVVGAHLLREDVLGTLTGTHDWTLLSGSLVAPNGAIVARVELYTDVDPDSSGVAWFDDTALIGPPGAQPAAPVFSTYLGGLEQDQIRDVAVDAQGNIYLTGGTISPDFPVTPGAFQTVHNDVPDSPAISAYDVFVTKLDATGHIIWSTFVGGRNHDRAYAIEVDDQGSVYVAGRAGDGFPVTAGAFQTSFQGGQSASFYGPQDGFVFKLSPDGSTLVWASYFGTPDPHIVRDLDVDPQGAIYIGSAAESGAYPAAVNEAFQNGFQSARQGGVDGVVAKISGDGAQVLWATYLGGSGDEGGGPSIRVDAAGNAYFVTSTTSLDIPTTPGAYDRTYNGGGDLYVAKLSPDGTSLVYATYVGGSQNEALETHNLAIDTLGQVYGTGPTSSSDFPTTAGVLQEGYGGGLSDAYLFKLSATGSTLLLGTYLGGDAPDSAEGIAVDDTGTVYLAGGTASDDFPVTGDAYQAFRNGADDAVAVVLSRDFAQLVYATYLGGAADDVGRTVAVGTNGRLYLAGQTQSGTWPIVNPLQSSFGGGTLDGIVAVFQPAVPLLPGDFDQDGDVDLNDFAQFETCFTGPDAGPIAPGCEPGDFDNDGDIDCDDWAQFEFAWTGSGSPPPLASCATPIPTLSRWGLVALGTLTLVTGAVAAARRWPA